MMTYFLCGLLSLTLTLGGVGPNILPDLKKPSPNSLAKAPEKSEKTEKKDDGKKEEEKKDSSGVGKKEQPEKTGSSEKKKKKTSEDSKEGEEEKAKGEEEKKEKATRWHYSGGLGLSYRLRGSNSSQDQDLWGSLGAEISYREKGREKAKLVLQGIGQIDLDNSLEPIFPSLADTYRDQNRFELYTAYLDFHLRNMDNKLTTRFRAGRQHRFDVEGVHFDGLSARTSYQEKLFAEIYGGVPLRFFETSRDGNWLFGSAFGMKLTSKLSAAFEYVHIRDRTSSDTTIFEDDYYSVRARFYPIKNLLLWGRYTFVDDRPRKGEVHVRAGLPNLGVYYGGSLVWQSATLNDYSTEFSQYFPLMQTLHPYVYGNAFAMADLFKHLIVKGAFTFREVLDKDNLGIFNHSYQRAQLCAIGYDLMAKGLEASLGLSYWNASDNADISAVEGEVAYVYQKKFRFALGTHYNLYKYRFNFNDERTRTRSIYFKASYKINKNAKIKILYEAERSDVGTTNYLFFTIRYVF